ncbi:hypothetical protein Hanom_Chr17g01547261 [Helianthus anomalus]
MRGDKTISAAKNKSVTRPKQLNSCKPNRFIPGNILIILGTGQWNNERNIMSRIHLHDLTNSYRPIHPFNLP